MNREFQAHHVTCEWASSLAIARDCILDHACTRCPFYQWVEDTGWNLDTVHRLDKKSDRPADAA